MPKVYEDTIEAKIIEILNQADRPMTLAEIKEHFNPRQCHTVTCIAAKMARQARITRIARGKYRMKLNRPAAMQDDFWDHFDKQMDKLRKAGY